MEKTNSSCLFHFVEWLCGPVSPLLADSAALGDELPESSLLVLSPPRVPSGDGRSDATG